MQVPSMRLKLLSLPLSRAFRPAFFLRCLHPCCRARKRRRKKLTRNRLCIISAAQPAVHVSLLADARACALMAPSILLTLTHFCIQLSWPQQHRSTQTCRRQSSVAIWNILPRHQRDATTAICRFTVHFITNRYELPSTSPLSSLVISLS
jgi:hypothetical protein